MDRWVFAKISGKKFRKNPLMMFLLPLQQMKYLLNICICLKLKIEVSNKLLKYIRYKICHCH